MYRYLISECKALGVCSHRLTSDWALTIRMQVDNDISDDNVGS